MSNWVTQLVELADAAKVLEELADDRWFISNVHAITHDGRVQVFIAAIQRKAQKGKWKKKKA